MAQIIGKICAPTGKYLKDGEEKTSWARCGVLMKTDNGFRIKLDTIPVGGGEQGIWFSVFEDEQGQSSGRGGQTSSRGSQGRSQGGEQDDIPF